MKLIIQIADKVEEQVSIRSLFTLDPLNAKQRVREAKEALDSWEATYLDVRRAIEDSGNDNK